MKVSLYHIYGKLARAENVRISTRPFKNIIGFHSDLQVSLQVNETFPKDSTLHKTPVLSVVLNYPFDKITRIASDEFMVKYLS